MRRLVVRGVMGGVVWVGGGGHRCRAWGSVMGSLVAVAGGGIRGGMCRRGYRHRLAGAGCRVLCPWPGLGGGAGGGGVGVALLVVGGWGWVLCWLGVWASLWVVWVLRVCAVWPLRFLTGCGAGVWVGGGRMSVRVGLWSVCNGWLLVDGARWYLAHANCTPFFSPKHLDFVTKKKSFFCHLENTFFQTLPKNAFS